MMSRKETEDSAPLPTCSRRVLMIAAAFPPTGGPGVQRSAKFAKYLPRFGWQPIVWTLDHIEGLPRDATLLEDLPPDVIRYAPRLRGRFPVPVGRAGRDYAGRESLASRFISALNWRLPATPNSQRLDDFAVWAAAGLDPLTKLVKTHRIEVLYSTFSPASNHWLGLMLKERTGLPWVADFRDLWIDDCRYHEPSPSRHRAHREFQWNVLTAADAVIGVTPSQTRILSRHVPALRDKFFTITNGFDPADFANVASQPRADRKRFVVSHVGRLDKWRATVALIEGFRGFAAQLGSRRKSFEFRAVGHASPETLKRLEQGGFSFSFVPYVSHKEAIREMQSADGLLLPLPTGTRSETIIAAKLFEYLAARRPILAVGPQGGECEKIVTACNAGLAVPMEAPAVAAALQELFKRSMEGHAFNGCPAEHLQSYSRIPLTGQLAAILDQVSNGALQDRFDDARKPRGRTCRAGRPAPTGPQAQELAARP